MKYLTAFALTFIITFINCALIVKTTGVVDGFVLTILLGQATLGGLLSALIRWCVEK